MLCLDVKNRFIDQLYYYDIWVIYRHHDGYA